MAWDLSVPTSATTPSASCQQFQDNWAALEIWSNVDHFCLSADSTSAGKHFLERSKTFACSFPGTAALASCATSFYVPFSCTILAIYAVCSVAPSGTALIFDVNKNDSTIWVSQGNRVSISAEELSGYQDVFDVDELVRGSILTVDIDQIGSSFAGEDVTIAIKVVATL